MAERHQPGADSGAESAWGLCAPFMTQLPVSGALISVVDRAGHRSTIAATDPVAARWDELELELGSGPLRDAAFESAPQLVPDVRASSMNSLVGAQLEQLGVLALFAFPLVLGSATVGVAGVYRTTTGALPADALAVALQIARSTTVPAIREALRLAALNVPGESADRGPGLRRELHQATGMVSVQLNVSTTAAFARLRAHAISTGRSITAVSVDIVDGLLSFADLDLE